MKKRIKLNGADITDLLTPEGYEVTYTKVSGSGSGYMQDGSYTEHVLRRPPTITIFFMPLSEAQLSALLPVLMADYIKANFFDPASGGYRDAMMVPEAPQTVDLGAGTDGVNYWNLLPLQLTDSGREVV